MKKLYLSLALLFAFSNVQACVTYHPNSNIYTIDGSGCVKKIPVKR